MPNAMFRQCKKDTDNVGVSGRYLMPVLTRQQRKTVDINGCSRQSKRTVIKRWVSDCY